MFNPKSCLSCGAKLNPVSNRKQNCCVCGRDICSTCGVKSPSMMGEWACGTDYQNLARDLRMGNNVFCRKCKQFGPLPHGLCSFCGAPACSKCISTYPCIEKHPWCGICNVQNWSAKVPTIALGDEFVVKTGPDTAIRKRPASLSYVTLTRCPRDDPSAVKAAMMSHLNFYTIAEQASAQGYYLEPDPRKIVRENNYHIIIQTIKAAHFLGFDIKDLQESVITLVMPNLDFTQFLEQLLVDFDREPLIVSSILMSRSFAVMNYFINICDSVYDKMLDERLANFRTMPKDFVKLNPDMAVIWAWSHSRCLKNPHEGKRALSEISMGSPFFQGLGNSLDGIVEYDPEKCLSGLKMIRNDPAIHHNLVDFSVKRIEWEAKRLREVAPKESSVRIEKLHLGDVVAGAKIGSQVEIRDSIVSRSTIGGGNEAGEAQFAKFCPECGRKLDTPAKFCPECGMKLAR